MPTPVLVTSRIVALQYDGTNSAAVLALANADKPSPVFTIDSEDGTGLALASAQPSVWPDVFLAPQDWCLGGPSAVPSAQFAATWHVLGDA